MIVWTTIGRIGRIFYIWINRRYLVSTIDPHAIDTPKRPLDLIGDCGRVQHCPINIMTIMIVGLPCKIYRYCTINNHALIGIRLNCNSICWRTTKVRIQKRPIIVSPLYIYSIFHDKLGVSAFPNNYMIPGLGIFQSTCNSWIGTTHSSIRLGTLIREIS